MSASKAEVTKAVILAAGKSQRLEALNLGKPKPLIEVQGKPLIEHHLDRCREAKIQEVFINLHYLPEMIKTFVGDGSRWGLKVTYNFEQDLVGTGGAVKNFSPFLKEEKFLVLYGDNYCTFPLSEILKGHQESKLKPDMSIVLFQLEDVSQSGVAVIDERGLIQSFIEKPAPGTTTSKWVNAGIYLIEPNLLPEIPEGTSDFGKDLIPLFLSCGKRVLGIKTTGRVIAVDTPELLKKTAVL